MLTSPNIYPDVAALNIAAAACIADHARSAIAHRGRFTMALSGGSSVAAPYSLLAAAPAIDWTKVYVFWGDDRCVEKDNPYSNYRLAHEALLSRLPQLPAANVFAIPGDAPTPAEGARRYEALLRRHFAVAEGELPRFDLMQNGMGPDGHTASLFPHSAALRDDGHLALANHAGLAPWVDRITLTLPVFNAARCVLFITAGAAKAAMLKAVLQDGPNLQERPSSAVRPTDGELIWMVDREIAALLETVA